MTREYNKTGLRAHDASEISGDAFLLWNMSAWFRVSRRKGWVIEVSNDRGETWRNGDHAQEQILNATVARMIDRSEWFDYQPEPEPEVEGD